jgi:hypothetical protein
MTSTMFGKRSETAAVEHRERKNRRFLEVVLGDFGRLVRLNLLLCVVVLPSGLLYALVLGGGGGGWALMLALVASSPVGGAIAASMFCVTQILQRESVSIWFDFKRKFVESVRQLALPGIVMSAFIFAEFYFWAMVFSGADVGIWAAVLLLLSLCLVLMVSPYVFLQVAYLDARLGRVLVNALVLSSSNVLRTFAGMLCASFVWFALALFLPVSLVLVPGVILFGFSLSLLANLVFIWPIVDMQFGISDELKARRAEGVRDVIPLFGPPD